MPDPDDADGRWMTKRELAGVPTTIPTIGSNCAD